MIKRKKKRLVKLLQLAAANSFTLLNNEPAYAGHVEKMHEHVRAKKYGAAVKQITKAQDKGFSHYKYTMVQNEKLCDAMGKRLRSSQSVWPVRT